MITAAVTRRTAALVVFVFVVLLAAAAPACEGEHHATYRGIAVDRCMARDATLTFSDNGMRHFITISASDARKLRDQLNSAYPTK